MTDLAETYPIPLKFYAKYSKLFIGMLIFMDLGPLLIEISLLNNKTVNHTPINWTFVIAYYLFIALLHVDFIHGQILKKQYVEINDNCIKLKTIFSEQFLEWDRIISFDLKVAPTGYVQSVYIEINGEIKLDELFYGYGTIKIPVVKYANLSEDKLFKTIEIMRSLKRFQKLDYK